MTEDKTQEAFLQKSFRMPKNKLVILIQMLTKGGAERVASRISSALPDDIEQTIVLFYKQISYDHKGNILSFDMSPSKNIFKKAINFIKMIIHFKRAARDLKPNTVLSFMETANILNIIVKKLFRNRHRCIISVRNVLSKELLHKGVQGLFYRILIKYLYNHSDGIIAVSHGVRRDLIKNFGLNEDKVRVIYNPLDIEEINASAREDVSHHFFNADVPVIINIGRLCRQKGQSLLIKAFAGVRKRKVCRLIIVGTGDLENDLKNEARELNVEKDILFLNFQKNPLKYVARATIFVMSSLFEGFPNALIEVMACGIPVVSFDCASGPREILAPDTPVDYITRVVEKCKYGILVPVGNEEMLKEAILLILEDGNLRHYYSTVSTKRAQDFRIQGIVDEYLKICFDRNREAFEQIESMACSRNLGMRKDR